MQGKGAASLPPLNTCPCDSSSHLFGSGGDYCPGPAQWGRLIAATRELVPLLQILSPTVRERQGRKFHQSGRRGWRLLSGEAAAAAAASLPHYVRLPEFRMP
ncbi:hypothetical protein E2C01_074615 [Portunus trituberculatus]|uniref:Uncharacterized protein n=1 Tax=Portunus trituberculatus TaxID=210409 RepID=A0A5B7I3R2_PORTR|nr:hypothetical protein [Portunus trituberculatus]